MDTNHMDRATDWNRCKPLFRLGTDWRSCTLHLEQMPLWFPNKLGGVADHAERSSAVQRSRVFQGKEGPKNISRYFK